MFWPRSLVYGVKGGRRVGTYTDGTAAVQPGFTAFVIDTRNRSILAWQYFSGGEPDDEVANYRLFSSRVGSDVDIDDVEDWFYSLPLESREL